MRVMTARDPRCLPCSHAAACTSRCSYSKDCTYCSTKEAACRHMLAAGLRCSCKHSSSLELAQWSVACCPCRSVKVIAAHGFLEACAQTRLAAMGRVLTSNGQLPGHSAKASSCARYDQGTSSTGSQLMQKGRQGRPSAQQHQVAAALPGGNQAADWPHELLVDEEEVLEVPEGTVCRMHTAASHHDNHEASQGPRSAPDARVIKVLDMWVEQLSACC